MKVVYKLTVYMKVVYQLTVYMKEVCIITDCFIQKWIIY